MDVARGWRGRRAREPTLSIPAFNSMCFSQGIFEHMPARYDGVDYPDYFARQCQEYFGSLCDPKPTEGQFIMFIMSRFVSFARSWAQWIVAEKPRVLEDVRLFFEQFFVEFGEPRQKYDLDKVLWEGTARTPTAPLLHVYYEQARQRGEKSREVSCQGSRPSQARSLVSATSQAPAKSPIPDTPPQAIPHTPGTCILGRYSQALDVAAMKQLELDLSEREAQLSQAIKAQAEAQRQVEKIQTQVRDQSRYVDELRAERCAIRSGVEAREHTVQSLEAEKMQLCEDLAAADRRQRQFLQERTELHNEVTSCKSQISALRDEKRQFEVRISQLEEELEKKQKNIDLVSDQLKKANTQVNSKPQVQDFQVQTQSYTQSIQVQS